VVVVEAQELPRTALEEMRMEANVEAQELPRTALEELCMEANVEAEEARPHPQATHTTCRGRTSRSSSRVDWANSVGWAQLCTLQASYEWWRAGRCRSAA
jgi:hypothetical protein